MARREIEGLTLSRPGCLNGQTNTSPSRAAGIAIPDTKLAGETTGRRRRSVLLLQRHGVPEGSIRRAWTAIALRTAPGIPQFMEREVALVTAGVEYDVLGIGYDAVGDSDRAEITALHTRPDFKRRILEAFVKGITSKPETTFGNVEAEVLEHFKPGSGRGDFVEIIQNSSWPE
jgi:hypothetical protein